MMDGIVMEATDAKKIPTGWSRVRLADVGSFLSGSGFPLVYQGNTSGDLPFFKVSDFSNSGNERSLNRANHYVDEKMRKKMGARLFPEGAIAFAKIGAAIFLERKRIIEQASCLDNNMAAFVLASPLISRDLILAHLQSFPLGSLVSSTALPAISSTDLKSIGFPLPDDPKEQEAIAEALSDADALIEGLERLIAKKRHIKHGAMQDLLTAKRRLPGFSGEWEEVQFETAFMRINAKKFQVQASEYATDGNIPIVDQGKNLVAGYTNVEARRFSPPSSGLIIFGDHTRIVKFVDFDFALGADGTQPLGAMDGFHTRFLSLSLQSKEIPNTGYNRHFKFLKEMTFAVPKNIDEQQAVASILTDMDAEIQALETRIIKARQVKEGMMQNLLTGRIRLV